MFNLDELLEKLKRGDRVEFLRELGDVLQYFLPWSAITFIAFTGNAAHAWAWLIGCMAAPLFASVIKRLMNDTKWGPRPNGGQHSFPSGHTTSAFAGAAAYLMVFGWFWAIIPVLLAALTGYSRVASKNHWPRDVVAGAALGIVVVVLAFWII